MRIILYSVYLLLFTFSLFGQKPNFAPPAELPIILNGNFGEIRSNHFHTGIDIKTNGLIGLPIYSADDGFVSRIAVSATGFGNVLYIDHPSGHTTVYAHLDSFSKNIAEWVKKLQYDQCTFELNVKPDPGLFPVKKGEKIATSGNSGSSAGPHLHFEIRNTATEVALNPLHFNFDVKDATKPVAQKLYVYPLSEDSHISNKTTKQRFELALVGESYKIKNSPMLSVYGDIGFGVDAIDYLDGNWSKCGINQMDLWIDEQLVYSFEIEEMNFDNNRYINSHIDYDLLKRTGEKIHKCYIDEGNFLPIYKQTVNRGIFNFSDGNRHKVRIAFFDVNMNAQKIEFDVVSTKPIEKSNINPANLFSFNADNKYIANNIEIYMAKGNLYTNINFLFNELHNPINSFSKLFKVHEETTPIHKSALIKIKADNLPKNLQDKALICLFDPNTKKISSLGGQYEKGWIKAEVRTFGNMLISVDTIAPTIRPLSIKDNTLLETGRIRFKIEDELSGIASYNGFINGNWVLFEYDAKNDLLTYFFDNKITKGQTNKIELLVKDKKGNYKIFESTFRY